MMFNSFQTARADVTLEELQGVDPNVLTLMFQEQLRLTKRDAAFREMPMGKQGFAFQSEHSTVVRHMEATSSGQSDAAGRL